MKCTTTVAETVAEGIRKGLTVFWAARSAGISTRSYHRWRQVGQKVLDSINESDDESITMKKNEEACLTFYNITEKARADLLASLLKKLEEKHGDDKQVIMWLLERQFPEEFGRSRPSEDPQAADRESDSQPQTTGGSGRSNESIADELRQTYGIPRV